MQPELHALELDLRALRQHPRLAPHVDAAGQVTFASLPLDDIAALLGDPTGNLFLMAAADLSRTTLRGGTTTPDAQLVAAPLRRAHVVRSKLPPAGDFSTVVQLAMQRRASTVGRSVNAATETLFRERLEFEGLGLRMRGAFTSGLLIGRRKPDGVYPNPETGEPPELYLEIKKINRVRDDIQKRLYEIAEVSLELKYLYGDLELTGLGLRSLLGDADRSDVRQGLRKRVTASRPVVVALLLCSFEEVDLARAYREGAEAFIDRLFLADEIDECIAFIAERVPASGAPA